LGSDLATGPSSSCRPNRTVALPRETSPVRADALRLIAADRLAGLDERGARLGWRLLRWGRLNLSRKAPDTRRLLLPRPVRPAVRGDWRRPGTSPTQIGTGS